MKKKLSAVKTKGKVSKVKKPKELSFPEQFKDILNEAISVSKKNGTAILNNGPFAFIINRSNVWLLNIAERKGVQVVKSGKPANSSKIVISKDGVTVSYTHKVTIDLWYDIKPATETDDGIHQMLKVSFTNKKGESAFNVPEFAFKRILATYELISKKSMRLVFGGE